MMTYAAWAPGEDLTWRRSTLGELERLVGGRHGAHVGVTLWRHPDNLLKLMASDVSMLFPNEYGTHVPQAEAFVAALGGPAQPWAGVIAVYGIDSIEGGFPEPELTEQQIGVIAGAYRAATGREPVDGR